MPSNCSHEVVVHAIRTRSKPVVLTATGNARILMLDRQALQLRL